MQTENLIQMLIEQTRQSINRAEQLKNLDIHTLTWRKNQTTWNILECLEHLNLYGNFYLPQIEKKIKTSPTKQESVFKSSWLGSFFAKSMLPKEKLNKMNTFKDKNPIHSKLDASVIDTFIQQEIKLLELLHQARHINLNKVKIETSLSSLITLTLGDTFQFYNNHILRHLEQIEKIRMDIKNS